MNNSLESQWMDAANESVEAFGNKLAGFVPVGTVTKVTMVATLPDGSTIECNSEIESLETERA